MNAPLTLVMLAGMPGAGKSTLARALADQLGWLVLDKDVVHTTLLAQGVAADQAGPVAYQVTVSLAEDLVQRQHRSLLLDTAGRQPSILAACQRIAQASGSRLRVVRCTAPSIVRAARMAGRAGLPSQWAADDTPPEVEAAWYAHLPAETLLLDMTQPLAAALAQAAVFVEV